MKKAQRIRGSIIPRGPSTFLVRVYAGEEGGRRTYRHETVHGTRHDAERKRTELLSKADTGTLAAPQRITVDLFLNAWLAAVESTLRPKTHEDYTGLLGRYVRPAIGSKALAKVSPLDIQAIYAEMSKRELAPRTVRYTHAVLRSALQYAVDQDYLVKNPARRPKLPRQKRDNAREELRVLAPDQVHAFMKSIAEHELQPVFVLAIATGLRPSEYLALRWKDVDLESGQVSVRRTVSWFSGKEGAAPTFAFDDVKRKRSRRMLDVGDQVIAVLKGHKKRQNEIRLMSGAGWEDLGLVFASIEGRPLHERNILRTFRGLLAAARLPKLRLYDLRHTYATNAIAGGVPARVVSERLGHASVAFTLDTYAHVLPSQQQDAAAQADAIVFGASPAKKGAR